MTTNIRTRALAAATSLILSFSCLAAPDQVVTAVQDRCEKQASAEFELELGAANTAVTDLHSKTIDIHNYRSHYNSRLGACFYLAHSIHQDARRGWPLGFSLNGETQTLFDIKQKSVIARYSKLQDQASPEECWVGRGVCRSEDEWERLIGPYVND